MTAGDPSRFLGRPVPAAFAVRQLVIPPGGDEPIDPVAWSGVLLVVEGGAVELVCTGGARRAYAAGSLLALDWVGTERLRNGGPDDVRLLAIGRPASPPPCTGRSPAMKFRTTLLNTGTTTVGFEVPPDVVAALGAGKRPPVVVTLNGSYSYRNTVAAYGDTFMIGLSAAHRETSGLRGGDEVEVDLELDTAPREVVVPADLAAALEAEPAARQTWDGLSYSNRRYHAELVEGAKSPETRRRRVDKAVAALRAGRAR